MMPINPFLPSETFLPLNIHTEGYFIPQCLVSTMNTERSRSIPLDGDASLPLSAGSATLGLRKTAFQSDCLQW